MIETIEFGFEVVTAVTGMVATAMVAAFVVYLVAREVIAHVDGTGY